MRINKHILRHKLLLALGLIQIAVILLLLIKLPASRCVNEFNFSSGNSSNDNRAIDLGKDFNLRSGAYELLIDYNMPDDCNATIWFTSEKEPTAVIHQYLALTDGKTQMYSRIWLPLGSGTDDLRLNLTSDKTCTVTHIRLREILKYRILRISGYLLLFVLTDAIIYLILSKKISKKTKYTILGILAITLLSSFPDFINNTFFQHDYDFHINRILSISDALSCGYFPVRIHFRLLHGYGFANSIFYGDILLYFPALLYNMGMSIQAAYKFYVIAISFGTAYITWWCVNKITGNYKIALFGSLLYTLSVYRITNVFIRGAMGEYTAMMFFPLICYGFMHIYDMPNDQKGTWKDSLPLCIGLTGCIQSHILSVEMSALFIVLFCLLNAKKTFSKNRFFILFKTLVATILINLWFLIPFLDYSRLPFKLTEYKSNIHINSSELFYVFNAFFRQNDFEPFIGISFVAVSAVFIILIIKYNDDRPLIKKADWFMGFGWLAVFMTSYYFPWELLRKISVTVYEYFATVQFAWRYLAIATVMLTFLAVLVADFFVRRNKSKSAVLFMISISVLCVVPVLMFYTNYVSNDQTLDFYSENDISSDHIASDFYLPSGTNIGALTLTEPYSSNKKMTISSYKEEKHRFTVSCKNSSDESQILQLPLINYKGYVAYDTKTNQTFEIVNSGNNTVNVKVPKLYSGTIKVEFKEPYYWRLAEIVSLLSVIVYLSLCFTGKKSRAKQNN